MNPVKRAAGTLAATTLVLLTNAATAAHAATLADTTTGTGALGFLRNSTEALITFVKQVLA
ncbi:hypothetical protein [Streptomyces sp. NPDC003863]